MLKCMLAVLFVASSLSGIPQARQRLEELQHAVDRILQDAVDSNFIPGAVIEIKKGDSILLERAYGFAWKNDFHGRPLEHPVKAGTGSLYDLASLTKVIGTTTSIMLLVDQGKLHVDDPVGKYIPGFNSPGKRSITIRNLLTHTSGIDEWYPLFYRAHNKQEVFRLIASLPLKYPVGEGRHYSDLGFTILGEIVEKVSGQSLDVFMHQHIFLPLGMRHTLFNPLKSGNASGIAATSLGNPYEYRMVREPALGFTFPEIDPASWNGWRQYVLRGEVNDGNAWYAEQGICGAAGLFSTVGDLQKFADMMLHRGKVGRKTFLSERTLRLFLTKDRFDNGLGWMMDPRNPVIADGPPGSFGHTGFTGTSIAVIPSLGASVILLVNRQNTGLSPAGTYYNLSPIRRKIFTLLMHYCDDAPD